jgi:hypothetical protein
VALFLVVDLAAKAVTGIPAHQLPLRFGLVRGIPLFVLGMLIARLPTPLAPRLADGLAIAAGVGVLALQVVGRFDHASLALLGLLIYAAGASDAKGWGWASLAGRLSFSLFLTNQLVAVVWFGLLRAVEGKLGLEGRCCGPPGRWPCPPAWSPPGCSNGSSTPRCRCGSRAGRGESRRPRPSPSWPSRKTLGPSRLACGSHLRMRTTLH